MLDKLGKFASVSGDASASGGGGFHRLPSISIVAFGTISSRSSPGLTAAISSNDSVPTEGLKGKPSRCERLPGVDP